jgi:hypothetical protein
VQCTHLQGAATPVATNSRVRVSGLDTILQPTPYVIGDCLAQTKCTAGSFLVGAVRVRSFGVPLVLTTSVSTSAPTPAPLQIVSTQQRVKGQ